MITVVIDAMINSKSDQFKGLLGDLLSSGSFLLYSTLEFSVP